MSEPTLTEERKVTGERTVLLRFAGPMQSWASAPYAVKGTEGVPTRSAVIGMIAGALGAERGQYPAWLAATDIAVRVDRPGNVIVDFHTVNPPPAHIAEMRGRHRLLSSLGADTRGAAYVVPNGAGEAWLNGKAPMTTKRAFLADAEFIVAVTHPDPARLDEMAEALRQPVFVTYLGRKAFTPAFPFNLGVHAGEPLAVLSKLPTSSQDGHLPVHLIEQDKNYARHHVSPDFAGDRTSLWNGWRASAALP